MGTPRSRFEIVTTDADQPFHVRYRAGNSKIVQDSENLTRKTSAKSGIASIAKEFGYEVTGWEDGKAILKQIAVVGSVPVLEVDERTPAS